MISPASGAGGGAASFPRGSGGQRPPLSSPNLASALTPRLPCSRAPNEPLGTPQQQTQQGESRSQPPGSRADSTRDCAHSTPPRPQPPLPIAHSSAPQNPGGVPFSEIFLGLGCPPPPPVAWEEGGGEGEKERQGGWLRQRGQAWVGRSRCVGWSWGQSQVATALRSRDQGVSGDEGRSCALGQRPLVDSAAAAATQSPCPAAVATGVVSPGHVDRVESTPCTGPRQGPH